MTGRNLWACPNEPPCLHGGPVHDIEDWEDAVPRCCVEGCDCGRREQESCGCITANGQVLTACDMHTLT